jgi:hypothetical protein
MPPDPEKVCLRGKTGSHRPSAIGQNDAFDPGRTWRPHGGRDYSQYFPVAFSSLLLNVPSGNLSMSNIALNAGV